MPHSFRERKERWLIPKCGKLVSKTKKTRMAQERLTLRKIREILRLKDAGMSNRAIARA
jgi:hypothetical protein